MANESLRKRELGLGSFKNELYPSDVIDKIEHYRTLESHSGCVNSLKWNRDGTYLASGSDDLTVKLWSVEGELLKSYRTSHSGNIFGVEFVPGTEDRYAMTGAADHRVIVLDLETGEELCSWETEGRVKKLSSTHLEPRICFSASEDRTIRMHDLRMNSMVEVVTTVHEGKTVAVSPRRSELLAVATDNPVVGIYDRRNSSKPLFSLCPVDKRHELAFYVTHVAFSNLTSHVIANYGRSSVYLFDLESKQENNFFHKLTKMVDDKEEVMVVDNLDNNHISDFVANVNSKGAELMKSKKFMKYIEWFNEHLTKDMSGKERSSLLLKRSLGFSQRRWEGDSYATARDCVDASLLYRQDATSFVRLAQSLIQLEQFDLAQDVLNSYTIRFPNGAPSIDSLLSSIEDGRGQGRLVKTLKQLHAGRIDYELRLTGHTNEATDIKEANLFGPREEYIVAGSDCGNIFIYERETGNVKALLKGDSNITNIVQPHPSLPLLASSGIDDEAHLWAPFNDEQLPLSKGECRRIECKDFEPESRVRNSQRMLMDMLLIQRLNEERPECIMS